MKRLAQLTALIVLFALVLALSSTVDAQGTDGPSSKEIMAKLHKGANPPLIVIKKQLQADTTPWDEVQKLTREYAALSADLGKHTPPKGEKDSWARLTQGYVADARAMDAAAQKKDKNAALAAQGKVTDSCKNCHMAHRVK